MSPIESTAHWPVEGPALFVKRAGRLGQLALAVIVGITLGRAMGGLWWWLVPATVCGIAMGWMGGNRRWRGVWCWGLLGCVVISAMWLQVRSGPNLAGNPIARQLGARPTLVRLRGRIADKPRIYPSAQGPLARFDYRNPRTRFNLEVSQISMRGRWRETSGTLLATCRWAEIERHEGECIEAFGWMHRFESPRNPAEPDYAASLAKRGIVGALTIADPANLDPLAEPPKGLGVWLGQRREDWAEAAGHSLAIGMRDQPRALTLVKMLLLGQWEADSRPLHEAFRRVGLAHLLSISGAHLGILLGLTWIVARLLVKQPPRVVMIVLAVLVMYLLTVPIRVPIVRASIMAGVWCLGNLTGRRLSGLAALAAAAIVLLVWHPQDLFEPGFQLSFLAVGSLMCFTGAVSNRLAPPPPLQAGIESWTWATRLGRIIADYLAVSIVVFLAVGPVVAFHFQLVSPLAVILALVSLPLFTVVLGLGYVKVLVGLALPSISLVLSPPLTWGAQALIGLVGWVDSLPLSSIALAHQPTLVWVGTSLACLGAMGMGWFKRRPIALGAVGVILVGWTWAGQNPRMIGQWFDGESKPAIVVRALAVGDGSCYVVESGGQAWMFDCGSQRYMDVGRQTIVPALRRMGLDRLDTLVISHADMDHFVGTLDVVDRLRVERVLMSRQTLTQALREPFGPTGFLVRQLHLRGLSPKPIARGWSEQYGATTFRVLWPAKNFTAQRTNNTSVVLSVRRKNARLLMTGDIMTQAMHGLERSTADLQATVCELPHHGGFVEAAPSWLHAVHPKLVIQSSGYLWQQDDHWRAHLDQTKVKRLVTYETGMITVRIDAHGNIHTDTFLSPKPSK